MVELRGTSSGLNGSGCCMFIYRSKTAPSEIQMNNMREVRKLVSLWGTHLSSAGTVRWLAGVHLDSAKDSNLKLPSRTREVGFLTRDGLVHLGDSTPIYLLSRSMKTHLPEVPRLALNMEGDLANCVAASTRGAASRGLALVQMLTRQSEPYCKLTPAWNSEHIATLTWRI